MSVSAGQGQPDDPELVDRMRHGDEAALETCYARYGGLVYTLALRIVGDPELAREVLQDTFLRAWDGRDSYDPARGRVPWWLMGIARNGAIDLLRSRSHQARLRERESLSSSTVAPTAGGGRHGRSDWSAPDDHERAPNPVAGPA